MKNTGFLGRSRGRDRIHHTRLMSLAFPLSPVAKLCSQAPWKARDFDHSRNISTWSGIVVPLRFRRETHFMCRGNARIRRRVNFTRLMLEMFANQRWVGMTRRHWLWEKPLDSAGSESRRNSEHVEERKLYRRRGRRAPRRANHDCMPVRGKDPATLVPIGIRARSPFLATGHGLTCRFGPSLYWIAPLRP